MSGKRDANEYCMSEILPWVRAILQRCEITVPEECLDDYLRLCQTINLYR